MGRIKGERRCCAGASANALWKRSRPLAFFYTMSLLKHSQTNTGTRGAFTQLERTHPYLRAVDPAER